MNETQALAAQAGALIDQKKWEEADDLCREILRLRHHDYLGHFLSGLIREKTGRLDEALPFYTLACALLPTEDRAFQSFQRVAHQLGRLETFRCHTPIVIVTGSLFHEWGFDGGSLKEQALGGSETAVICMARELVRLGTPVTVYCNKPREGTYDGVVYRSNREFAVANRLAPPKILIASRFDSYLRPPMQAKKKILWAHDIAESEKLYGEGASGFDGIDLFFFLSRYQGQGWQKKFGIPDNKIVYTRNGFLRDDYPENEIPKKDQIMYFSRPSRGLDVCIEVFEKIREVRRNLELLVCCYSPYATPDQDPELRDYAPLFSRPGIRFAGGLKKSELAHELRQSLLLLYPNTTELETSCMAAIEAMAAGCPVVSSDRGALAETVPTEKAGKIVPYSSLREELVARLAEASLHVLSNAQQWVDMSRATKNHAVSKYPWDMIAREWLDRLKPSLES